ncbi:MAG: hypothetical protein AAF726_06420 [Planctomycetota bacterium]
MLSIALPLISLPSMAAIAQVPDTLATVEAMLTGDAVGAAAQVEQWVAGLPPIGSCPDCDGKGGPCPAASAAFEAWEQDWTALMDSKDFELDMARTMVEGLGIARSRSNFRWPKFEETAKRLRREGPQMLVMAVLRLELLERSEPEQQAERSVEWLRSSRSGRSKQLEALFELERQHVERFGEIRPQRGSVSDAIRDQRHRLKLAVDDRIGSAMQRGFDNRLQEALAVRWLTRHPNAERHDLIVESTAEVEEEQWSSAPVYFDACLALGTRASIEQCVETFDRIQDLRKELERERGRGAKLVKKRAPRDWELEKDDWTALREAVIAEHERVVDRRIRAVDQYRQSAEQRLAAFAARLDPESVPELGSERPAAEWTKWWKASRDALPERPAGTTAEGESAR